MNQNKVFEVVVGDKKENDKQVDRYQVEIAESALESVLVTTTMNDRLDLSVNNKNGKIIITAKPIPAH